MEDIKLWELAATQAKPLGLNNRLESEGYFEDILVSNPSLLMEDMTLVGRQTPTEGGPLDLLGIDPDGKLVVFELKRGTLSRDAVAQIIDYASGLDFMDLDDLADHIAERSGAQGIDAIEDFQEWYGESFGELESLKPLRMYLVGLGADNTTERMVRFLAQNSGMDISLLTFHAFDYNGKTILAKQVDVEAAEEPDRHLTRRRRTQAELYESFRQQVADSGLHALVEEVRAMFREQWPASRERANVYTLRIELKQGNRSRLYARIDVWNKDTIGIVFFPRAKALCIDAFREPVEEIRYATYPKDLHPLDDPQSEIQFDLTQGEWGMHKERLTSLVQSVYAAWQDRYQ